jgi:hypothetical protein
MNMQEFVIELHKRDFGVIFNTYIQEGVNYCFIIVTEKGNTGRFLKRECVDCDLNYTIENMLLDILKLKGEF